MAAKKCVLHQEIDEWSHSYIKKKLYLIDSGIGFRGRSLYSGFQIDID